MGNWLRVRDRLRALTTHRTVEVPVSKIEFGLNRCARNIRDLVQDAEILLRREYPTRESHAHATALAIFAYEELAKFSKLKKARQSAAKVKQSEKVTVKIDRRLFRDHHYKQKIAKKLLPKNARTLFPENFIRDHLLPDSDKTERIDVSPRQRTVCLFLDWDERSGDWSLGIPVNADLVSKFIQAIRAALVKLESNP